METRPFDLQLEIKNYFNRLHLEANLTKSDEIELETHIYEGVDSLEAKGLSVEEAFLITIKRIGKIDILSDEYNKVNPFFTSDKIRLYSITGLGLLLFFGTIFLFAYELMSLYSKAFLGRTTADTIIRLTLYFGLCFVVLAVFKWGKSFSLFLQKNIEHRVLPTVVILFLIPLLNFLLQPFLIRSFEKEDNGVDFNYKIVDNGDAQFINLSFYLLMISVLLLTLISFWSAVRKRGVGESRFSFQLSILFLIFFGVLISLGAVLVRYIPESNSGLQSSFFLMIIYSIGCFSIAFYNNDKLWLKFLIFSAFGLYLGNLLVL